MKASAWILILALSLFLNACSSKKKEKDPESSKLSEMAAEMDHLSKPAVGKIPEDPWLFHSQKNGVITFKNQKTLNTGLYDVNMIALMYSSDGARYILASGKEGCQAGSTCDAYTNLYLHKMNDPSVPVKKSFTGGGAPMPGRLHEANSKKKVRQQYRVFYGQCLTEMPQVVWIGWTTDEESKKIKLAAAYNLDGKKIVFKSLEEPIPKVEDITPKLRTGNCFEVRGIDQELIGS